MSHPSANAERVRDWLNKNPDGSTRDAAQLLRLPVKYISNVRTKLRTAARTSVQRPQLPAAAGKVAKALTVGAFQMELKVQLAGVLIQLTDVATGRSIGALRVTLDGVSFTPAHARKSPQRQFSYAELTRLHQVYSQLPG